jgi:hypothetical protein
MLRFVFLLLLILFPCSASAKKDSGREAYINQYKEIAIKHMQIYGIPASITLAQGCLESMDGKSLLATKGNNHFGIKCHDWKGGTIYKDDDKKNECFRKYDSAEESYKDHSIFLRFRDRYAFLFEFSPTDYTSWSHGLKKAGYATDPKYASRLISIIEEYKLYDFDREALKNYEDLIPPTPAQLEAIKEYKPATTSPLYKYNNLRKLYLQNGVVFLIANDNDTYESIADGFNLFKGEILRFNDLKQSEPLHKGTIVYLQSKKNNAAKHIDMHIAEEGETYYAISQRYGVKLKKILKYNMLSSKDISPRDGEAVILRKH